MNKNYSVNQEAGKIMGLRRTDVISIDWPCELGYHCPVCKYENLKDGNYDTRLEWSEYNAFIWCSVCNRDYPSCLCLPKDPVRAISVFLESVKDAARALSSGESVKD
jgi:hypothetical protein